MSEPRPFLNPLEGDEEEMLLQSSFQERQPVYTQPDKQQLPFGQKQILNINSQLEIKNCQLTQSGFTIVSRYQLDVIYQVPEEMLASSKMPSRVVNVQNSPNFSKALNKLKKLGLDKEKIAKLSKFQNIPQKKRCVSPKKNVFLVNIVGQQARKNLDVIIRQYSKSKRKCK